MIKIAITGNICTGKTFVLNRLKSIGYHTFSSDYTIKNSIYKLNRIKVIVSSIFPSSLDENGEINRNILAKSIFNDKKKKDKLEKIIYPQLDLLRKKFIHKSLLLGAKMTFYEVPLLFEKKLEKNFDKIVLVTCSKRTQKIRASKRDNLNDEKLKKILKFQINDFEKKGKVDYIINTDLDKFSTISKIKLLLKSLK
mgnify:CR=1 FL=1